MITHSSILARESHGQRRLVDYSPWVVKESNVIERLNKTKKDNWSLLLLLSSLSRV